MASDAISLVIPCYNEARSVPNLMESALELTKANPSIEIILVDNGSTDGTKRAITELASACDQIQIVTLDENAGYGGGIKEGLKHASGTILAWTHADMQTNPLDLLAGLPEGNHVRQRYFAKGLRKGRPASDLFFTFAMSIFETLLFRFRLRDINAQPTIFSRDLLAHVLSGPDDFGLDLHAYVGAKRKGWKVTRFPVVFRSREFGESAWNLSLFSRIRFIRRTIIFSVALAWGKGRS